MLQLISQKHKGSSEAAMNKLHDTRLDNLEEMDTFPETQLTKREP